MKFTTPIGKDKFITVDTDKLEFDKKGKLLHVGETKIAGKRKMAPDVLESIVKCYDLIEINGHYYDKVMIAAHVRSL